jgi:hypothetical protein
MFPSRCVEETTAAAWDFVGFMSIAGLDVFLQCFERGMPELDVQRRVPLLNDPGVILWSAAQPAQKRVAVHLFLIQANDNVPVTTPVYENETHSSMWGHIVFHGRWLDLAFFDGHRGFCACSA